MTQKGLVILKYVKLQGYERGEGAISYLAHLTDKGVRCGKGPITSLCTWPIMGILPRRCKIKANQIPPTKEINALEIFSGDMSGYSVHGQSFKIQLRTYAEVMRTLRTSGQRIGSHCNRYIKLLIYTSMLLLFKSLGSLI